MSNGRVWLHCFISLLLMRCASSHVRPSPRTVTLNKHQLRGVERTVQLDGDNRTFAVDVYYEVHYGYLQDGVSRFLPAQKYIEDWPNVNYKSENRIMCPQNLPPLELSLAANARNLRQADSESDSDLYSAYLEQLYIRNAKLSEDTSNCLTLNIHVPIENSNSDTHSNSDSYSSGGKDNDNEAKLPVVLYVHGDSTMFGTGNAFEAAEAAVRGRVIFITLNYRLGVFGFFAPAGGAQPPAAQYDVSTALDWIRVNIAAFGGDADRLTAIGDHAGASLLHALLLAPGLGVNPGRVSRLVLLQSNALTPGAAHRRGADFNGRVLRTLQCPTPTPLAGRGRHSLAELFCLANRTSADIQRAQLRVSKKMADAFEYAPAGAAPVAGRERVALLRSLEQLRDLPVLLVTSGCTPHSAGYKDSTTSESLARLAAEILGNPLAPNTLPQLLPLYTSANFTNEPSNLRVFANDGLSFTPQINLADLLRSKVSAGPERSGSVSVAQLTFPCSPAPPDSQWSNYFFGYHLYLMFGPKQFTESTRRLPFIREDARLRFLAYLNAFITKPQPVSSSSNAQPSNGETWPSYQTDRPELLQFDMVNNRVIKRQLSLEEGDKVRSWNRVMLLSSVNGSCETQQHCSATDVQRSELQRTETYKHSRPIFIGAVFPDTQIHTASRVLPTTTREPIAIAITATNGSLESALAARATPHWLGESIALIVIITIVLSTVFVVMNAIAFTAVYYKRKRRQNRLRKRSSACTTPKVVTPLELHTVETDTVNNSADTQVSSLLSSTQSDFQQVIVVNGYIDRQSVSSHNSGALKPDTGGKQLRFKTGGPDNEPLLNGTRRLGPGTELQEDRLIEVNAYRHTPWTDVPECHVHVGAAENGRMRQKTMTNSCTRFDTRKHSISDVLERESNEVDDEWNNTELRLQPLTLTSTML